MSCLLRRLANRSTSAALGVALLLSCAGGDGAPPADASSGGDAAVQIPPTDVALTDVPPPDLASLDLTPVDLAPADLTSLDVALPDLAQDASHDSDPSATLDSGVEAGPPGDDIVFDGLDSDGVRRILLWPAGSSTSIPLGAGYPGSNPSPRRDGRALLLQSLATETEPSGLMLVDDYARPARFFVERSGASEREPAWSPDGRRVLFVAHEQDPSGDVWVAEIDGDHLKDIRNLTPCSLCRPGQEAETTPAWSPDGTRIAFTSYAGPAPAIWVMNADGSGAHPVTTTDGQSADYFPSWSPDGHFIAFQRNGPRPARIGIVALEDRTTRFLDLPGSSYSPSWSRDGRQIALATKRDGEDANLVIVTVAGVEVRYLDRPGNDHHPTWLTR